VKILDLMWVLAGPMAMRVLADYGPTIVRVESTSRIDFTRTFGPWIGGNMGPENSGAFQNLHAGKLSLTLDLSTGAGRTVFLDLVRWADVVTESFSPKAMRAWGLDYESLRNVKPDLIMLSSCLMGQTGPLSMFAGFGNLAAAISGFFSVTGWPDRPPAGPFGAYTDYLSPRFTVAAILAALDHRDRTGEGQYIDQSQAEASLHFLTPALLDYTVNGRVATATGNRDPQMAPHGVYPAAGDDRWVAIAVTDDAAWARLCDAIGRNDLTQDARYAMLAGRREHHDELDTIVSAWTRERDPFEVEALLQAAGVAASAVQDSADLLADAQLLHRGHFVEVPHEIHGTTTVEGSRFHLSRTPARIERSAPTLGRDNFYVLKTILGYDAERIAELAAAGVLE
jgi:benzylsuccinate CoA-transferase BbsF subunit